jgi:hypothetical protein
LRIVDDQDGLHGSTGYGAQKARLTDEKLPDDGKGRMRRSAPSLAHDYDLEGKTRPASGSYLEDRHMKRVVLLVVSHVIALAIGFAVGIYILPILTAPVAPSRAEVQAAADNASYTGQFRRDLKGSDPLHWGEGAVSIGPTRVALQGRVAPGPDYKLYLAPSFVETKNDFMKVKASSVRVGDVQTFENFIVPVPPSIDVSTYNTVVVWCEAFSMFISAAQYR